MTKTDLSIHGICIASIKRATIEPYDFKRTKFYETNADFLHMGLQIDLEDYERVICSTFMDKDHFSVLTTRRLMTQQDGQLFSVYVQDVTDRSYGDFKGYRDQDITLGQVQLQNGSEFKYFIETGKAAMVMISGISALIQITN